MLRVVLVALVCSVYAGCSFSSPSAGRAPLLPIATVDPEGCNAQNLHLKQDGFVQERDAGVPNLVMRFNMWITNAATTKTCTLRTFASLELKDGNGTPLNVNLSDNSSYRIYTRHLSGVADIYWGFDWSNWCDKARLGPLQVTMQLPPGQGAVQWSVNGSKAAAGTRSRLRAQTQVSRRRSQSTTISTPEGTVLSRRHAMPQARAEQTRRFKLSNRPARPPTPSRIRSRLDAGSRASCTCR